MTIFTLLLIKIIVCITISLVVIWRFQPTLGAILTEICGTPERAEFWRIFTQLMLVISPLLIVIFYASTDSLAPIIPALTLKEVISQILLGVFVALLLVACVIWRTIQSNSDHIAPTDSAPRSK